jgi:hypothetical protein
MKSLRTRYAGDASAFRDPGTWIDRAITEAADQIERDVENMTEEDVTAFLVAHDLEHTVTPEAVEEALALAAESEEDDQIPAPALEKIICVVQRHAGDAADHERSAIGPIKAQASDHIVIGED